MHRLTEHIRGFGTDTSITDGVDSITQFLLYHAGRIKSWLMPSQTEEATMEDLDPLVASFHNMLKTGAQDESELDQEDAVMAKYSGRQLWN